MTTYLDLAHPIHAVINTAWQTGFIAETLAGLTDLAYVMAQTGRITEAANVIACVLNHPDVPYDTFDRAEDLFLDLEAQVSAQVLDDARAQATYMTLRGVVEMALAVE